MAISSNSYLSLLNLKITLFLIIRLSMTFFYRNCSFAFIISFSFGVNDDIPVLCDHRENCFYKRKKDLKISVVWLISTSVNVCWCRLWWTFSKPYICLKKIIDYKFIYYKIPYFLLPVNCSMTVVAIVQSNNF